ncbi:MAG: helix-turn-helix domain-containing protein [Lawsonibacter sp.]
MYRQVQNQTTDLEMQSVDFASINISTFYADLLNEQALEFFHAHKDTIELYYVLEDSLDMHLLDEHFPPQKLNSHDFILINSGVGHNVNYSPNHLKKYFVFNFSVSKAKKPEKSQTFQKKDELSFYYYAMQVLSKSPFLFLHDKNGEIAFVIEAIITCSTLRQRHWKLLRRTLYSQLIILLLNHCKNIPTEEPSSEKNIAIAVTQYLHANYQNPNLDMKTLSKKFNFSTRQLMRVFEDYFASTPSKTLTFYRISYAKNYLINTDWTVEAIAEAVGFSSAASLSRCFKKIENITISEFKERNKP